MQLLPVYRKSFFLSPGREDGLRLRAIYEDDHVCTDFRIGERFQSETETLYNGIVLGIIDELMWYNVIIKTKKMCIAKKISMEFLKPLSCDTPYRATSKLLNTGEDGVHIAAWVEESDGRMCIRISALFEEGSDTNLREIIDCFDFSQTTPEMKAFFDSLLQ